MLTAMVLLIALSIKDTQDAVPPLIVGTIFLIVGYITLIDAFFYKKTMVSINEIKEINQVCAPFLGIDRIEPSSVVCKNGYTFNRDFLKKE